MDRINEKLIKDIHQGMDEAKFIDIEMFKRGMGYRRVRWQFGSNLPKMAWIDECLANAMQQLRRVRDIDLSGWPLHELLMVRKRALGLIHRLKTAFRFRYFPSPLWKGNQIQEEYQDLERRTERLGETLEKNAEPEIRDLDAPEASRDSALEELRRNLIARAKPRFPISGRGRAPSRVDPFKIDYDDESDLAIQMYCGKTGKNLRDNFGTADPWLLAWDAYKASHSSQPWSRLRQEAPPHRGSAMHRMTNVMKLAMDDKGQLILESQRAAPSLCHAKVNRIRGVVHPGRRPSMYRKPNAMQVANDGNGTPSLGKLRRDPGHRMPKPGSGSNDGVISKHLGKRGRTRWDSLAVARYYKRVGSLHPFFKWENPVFCKDEASLKAGVQEIPGKNPPVTKRGGDGRRGSIKVTSLGGIYTSRIVLPPSRSQLRRHSMASARGRSFESLDGNYWVRLPRGRRRRSARAGQACVSLANPAIDNAGRPRYHRIGLSQEGKTEPVPARGLHPMSLLANRIDDAADLDSLVEQGSGSHRGEFLAELAGNPHIPALSKPLKNARRIPNRARSMDPSPKLGGLNGHHRTSFDPTTNTSCTESSAEYFPQDLGQGMNRWLKLRKATKMSSRKFKRRPKRQLLSEAAAHARRRYGDRSPEISKRYVAPLNSGRRIISRGQIQEKRESRREGGAGSDRLPVPAQG